jgi:glycosyltransferase involved in cell wall biosynthesis
MGQALRSADIYIQPSWSEGCSFAVAEAMLHGRPTVVTPYGGLPEQVQDGVTGVVCLGGSPQELADGVGLLIGDKALAARVGLAGKKAAEEMYAMDKWLDETTAALCQAAAGSGSPR